MRIGRDIGLPGLWHSIQAWSSLAPISSKAFRDSSLHLQRANSSRNISYIYTSEVRWKAYKIYNWTYSLNQYTWDKHNTRLEEELSLLTNSE